jgi:hypothetical protein
MAGPTHEMSSKIEPFKLPYPLIKLWMADPAISSPGVQELSSQAEILVSLLRDVCDRPANRRAGVSGAKKAWMVMEVAAGLPAWFGGVGSSEAFPIRRVILRPRLG